MAWSGVGVNLATNEPTQEALLAAVRTVLDRPAYRMRASQMADEFARIDTRSEILSIIKQVVVNQKLELLAETMGISGVQRAAGQRLIEHRPVKEGGKVDLPPSARSDISKISRHADSTILVRLDAHARLSGRGAVFWH